MAEVSVRPRWALILGLVLLLIGVAGLVVAVVSGVQYASCPFSRVCSERSARLLLGAFVAIPGLIGGVVLLRHRPIKVILPAAPGGPSHPAWALVSGAIALAAAMVCGLLALNWVLGYATAAGNPFAGVLLLLGLGAGVAAAGFLIAGIVLFAKKV